MESLTGQRHDSVQTESQELRPWTAVPTLFGFVSTVWRVMKESVDQYVDHPLDAADGDALR